MYATNTVVLGGELDGISGNLRQFLSAVYAALCCAVPVSVLCQLCPSVTFLYCIETVKFIIKLYSRLDSPIVQLVEAGVDPIPRGTLSEGWGQQIMEWEDLRFSLEIAVYLGNGTRGPVAAIEP